MNFLQAVEAAAETTAAAVAENVPQAVDALAEVPVEPEQSWLAQNSFLIMIGLMFLVMWLFMWRPEAKRRKQMQQFRNNLKKGDKIITAGGIYGVVKEVKENDPTILIEVDGNVTLRIDKNMIVADPSSLQQ
ncbi:MAG: preprotein translocase subunit YajC [Alistipes sp.]|nr:preprotein translocase subunit YajC [Alistipes sp.]